MLSDEEVEQSTLHAQPLIDLPTAVQLTQTVVETFGRDYIDKNALDGCMYEEYGKPACLVGQVLSLAGWTTEALYLLDNNCGPYDLFGQLDDAGVFLQMAQTQQDNGNTWGEALAYALQFGMPDAALV